MRIILARHGNTFETPEDAVMAGLHEDLPLVAKGREQAEELRKAFEVNNIELNAIYSGELQRTREFASIISNLPLQIDERLNELDYGPWGGKTNQEIESPELEAWNSSSTWPSEIFPAKETEVIQDLHNFYQKLLQRHAASETVLLVSSNGKLRYFLKLIPGEFEKRIQENNFKVKTGYVCCLEMDTELEVKFWNATPKEMEWK